LCTPSRVQIMTGQYNFRNYTEFGALHPEETTFGHLLKKAGYATCVVGKWQLAARNKGIGTYPDKAGFDEHCLWQVDRLGSRYWDPLIQENGKMRDDLKGKYGPDVFLDYIQGFMERKKNEPFFMYYPMALTHDPFVPTPDSVTAENRNKIGLKYFADMVAYMDKIIGKIVRKVDELGIRENTVILFSGDNGMNLAIESNLRDRAVHGGKGTPTDAGTHVPFIVNWLGTSPPGKVCDDLIDFSDFFPTLARIARAEIPGNLTVDGRSFLPQIKGEQGTPREWIFCHYDPRWSIWKPCRFVRDKRWKLYGDGRLFDLQADPLEKSPIGDSQDKEIVAIRRKFQQILARMK
ncbi:MAG: sulfatase-like hydrolase/transferase, partial [Candidatus Aminicenantes bacterium]|nr:sulfatase-like hydrolase/transferase [Candidatus Aminicenantes bacterium]